MVCVPVRSIIPLLKLGDYLSVQAHKPCSIPHIMYDTMGKVKNYSPDPTISVALLLQDQSDMHSV